jgi:hypothetical protein
MLRIGVVEGSDCHSRGTVFVRVALLHGEKEASQKTKGEAECRMAQPSVAAKPLSAALRKPAICAAMPALGQRRRSAQSIRTGANDPKADVYASSFGSGSARYL